MKLNPKLNDGMYEFKNWDGKNFPENAIVMFKEKEGTTIIVPTFVEADAWAWITCMAETALTDVGITAKFSKELSDAGISCNVFAPIHHDHIFVPWDRRGEAVNILDELD